MVKTNKKLDPYAALLENPGPRPSLGKLASVGLPNNSQQPNMTKHLKNEYENE